MQMIKVSHSDTGALSNALRNSRYLKWWKNGHDRCVLLIQAQDHIPICAKQGHLLGGWESWNLFSHPLGPQIPALLLLPWLAFPSFLLCPSSDSGNFPKSCQHSPCCFGQVVGPVEFCPLPFLGAAMSITCPWGQPWPGPADAVGSWTCSLLERKGPTRLQVFFKYES